MCVHQWAAKTECNEANTKKGDNTVTVWSGRASQVLADVIKHSSFSFNTVRFYRNKRTFLACLDPLGCLMGYKRRSLPRRISKIGQDAVYSDHLSFYQRADGRQTILLYDPSMRLWKTRTKTHLRIFNSQIINQKYLCFRQRELSNSEIVKQVRQDGYTRPAFGLHYRWKHKAR